jgi:hypothetical protein
VSLARVERAMFLVAVAHPPVELEGQGSQDASILDGHHDRRLVGASTDVGDP